MVSSGSDGLQDIEGFVWRGRFGKDARVAADADEPGLSQWTGGPTGPFMRLKPVASRFVLLMVRPKKRHEHVDVEQVDAHGKSLNSSLTLRAVIFRDYLTRSIRVDKRVSHSALIGDLDLIE